MRGSAREAARAGLLLSLALLAALAARADAASHPAAPLECAALELAKAA